MHPPSTPIAPPLAWLAVFAALAPGLALGAPLDQPVLGPGASFSRHGATVCASYAKDPSFDLYHDRIFARQGSALLPLSGLPPGVSKSIAGSSESVIASAFKACATAPSASSEVQWIDQSCMSAQGVCLPPRAYAISANGAATPLDAARAAALFSDSLRPLSAKPPTDGWSFGFKAK